MMYGTDPLALAMQPTAVKPASRPSSSAQGAAEKDTPGFGTMLTQKLTGEKLQVALPGSPLLLEEALLNAPSVEGNELQQELAAALFLQPMNMPSMVPVPQSQVAVSQVLLTQTTGEAMVQATPAQAMLEAAPAPLLTMEAKPQAATIPLQASNTEGLPTTGPIQQQTASEQKGLLQQGGQQGEQNQSDLDALQLTRNEMPQGKPLFHDVENLPIKVGDAPVLSTEAPDFDLQLEGIIRKSLEQGSERLTMKLSPEQLGTVVVELTRSQDGSLQLMLQAASPKAAQLLQEHSANLSHLLRGSTQAPVYVEVQQDASQAYYQQDRQQQQGNPQQQDAQHQQQQNQKPDQDFLAKLRLGLVSLYPDAS